jgi:NADH:ubiquinone oxidoreductase subunit E
VAGAEKITDSLRRHLQLDGDGDTDADGLFTVQKVACLGCCSLAPVLMINHATFGNLSPSAAVKILKKYQKGERS